VIGITEISDRNQRNTQLENEVKPLIAEFMQKRGLALSEEKTAITHIEEGFDFLGQNVRKYGGKMLIKPAKKKSEKLSEQSQEHN